MTPVLQLPDWVKDPVWLDPYNAITFVTYKGQTEPYMALWYHVNPKNGQCCFGSFGWRNPAPEKFAAPALWTLSHWEPLTVHPSLLCLDCGAHGWIREGKWVPA